ncbi:NUDIX hydrolase [Lutibacter sp.]
MNKEIGKNIYFDVDEFIPQHSVDCVIFGFDNQELKILLLKYKFGGFWTLPGGFIKKDEDMDNAAQRLLKERSGLDNVFLKQFYSFGNASRNFLTENVSKKRWEKENLVLVSKKFIEWINKRFITTGYFAMIDIRKSAPKPDIFSEKCEWIPVKKIPQLIYDHNKIIDKALEQLRIQLNYLPISINVLPNMFTMKQLQKLYEEILNKKLERSNFQRKMLRLGIFIRLEKQFTGAANKAPYMYRFNKEKYEEIIKRGIGFSY